MNQYIVILIACVLIIALVIGGYFMFVLHDAPVPAPVPASIDTGADVDNQYDAAVAVLDNGTETEGFRSMFYRERFTEDECQKKVDDLQKLSNDVTKSVNVHQLQSMMGSIKDSDEEVKKYKSCPRVNIKYQEFKRLFVKTTQTAISGLCRELINLVEKVESKVDSATTLDGINEAIKELNTKGSALVNSYGLEGDRIFILWEVCPDFGEHYKSMFVKAMNKKNNFNKVPQSEITETCNIVRKYIQEMKSAETRSKVIEMIINHSREFPMKAYQICADVSQYIMLRMIKMNKFKISMDETRQYSDKIMKKL